MSRTHHSGSAPSQRMLRVAELVRHAISDVLARGELNEPALAGAVVTAPRVVMSPDLKLATVYVVPLGGGDAKPIVAALERHKKFLRGEVAHRVNMKFAPDVRFRADETFDKMASVDAILASPKVRQDLAPRDDAAADDADEGGER